MARKRKQPAAAAANGLGSELPEHSLAVVTWLDATFDLDSEPKLLTLSTVGFIIKQTPEFITIAGEGSDKLDYFRSFTTIPAGMILAVRRLQPAE